MERPLQAALENRKTLKNPRLRMKDARPQTQLLHHRFEFPPPGRWLGPVEPFPLRPGRGVGDAVGVGVGVGGGS